MERGIFWGKLGKASILYKVLKEDLIGELVFGQKPKRIKRKSMQISEEQSRCKEEQRQSSEVGLYLE